MAASQNFRSAFNGFNREDVVHYIEYLNAKHTAEVNQLQSELDFVNSKLASAQQNTDLQAQLNEALSAIEVLKAERDEAITKANAIDPALEDRCADLEMQLTAALAAKAQAEEARDTALRNAAKCQVEQELEAYRRAERTERVARERAEQVYRQANGALADATAKVDEASAQITQMTDKVSAQLAQLQLAVENSKLALSDAAATLYTIRPGSGEN